VDWLITRLMCDEAVIADFALLSVLLGVGLQVFTCPAVQAWPCAWALRPRQARTELVPMYRHFRPSYGGP